LVGNNNLKRGFWDNFRTFLKLGQECPLGMEKMSTDPKKSHGSIRKA
jgi:hypothetical protein